MPRISIDWKAPDYGDVFKERARRLAWLREDASRLVKVKKFYATAPGGIAQFIDDWAMTMDPRVSGKGRTPLMPFLLFPKQMDLVNFIIRKWQSDEPGVLVKSRDVGASWIAFATACALCIFKKDMAVGFGSAKEDKLDRSGDPDTLFAKGRMFMRYLPPEFRAGYTEKLNATHLRMGFPDTGSSITGEAGDNMGRGGRKAIYFIDEAAFVERPVVIDGNLSANTNCRIDMSTVNGTANTFAQKALNGKVERMDITWRDDPRKDDAWYAKKTAEIDNPQIVAQELDCNFSASAEGVIIPSLWVKAAIDAHVKLGIKITGIKRGGLDIADMGRDKNAYVSRHGQLVNFAKSWSGSEALTLAHTAQEAFTIADETQASIFLYDGDGMGAGMRSDVKRINQARFEAKERNVIAKMYRGSGEVYNPEGLVKGTDRKNEDYYQNAKAQNWFYVRSLFRNTYNAVVLGLPYDEATIISIASTVPECTKLESELSQAIYKQQPNGKMLVDKLADGAMSPNLADALVIAFSLGTGAMKISDAALQASGGPTLGQ